MVAQEVRDTASGVGIQKPRDGSIPSVAPSHQRKSDSSKNERVNMTVNEFIIELSKYAGDTKIIVTDSKNGMVGVDSIAHAYLEDNSQRVIIRT